MHKTHIDEISDIFDIFPAVCGFEKFINTRKLISKWKFVLFSD